MKTKFLILFALLLTACGDNSGFDTENNTEFKSTELTDFPTGSYGICGNLIQEPGEECDRTDLTYCINCRYPRLIYINTTQELTAIDIGTQDLDQQCTDGAIKGDFYGAYGGGGSKTWKAWISKNDINIKDNIYHSPGLYFDLNGEIVAYSFTDLTDGSINMPLMYDQDLIMQTDKEIWTGTYSDGSQSNSTCNNWTSVSGYGTIGKTNITTKEWTSTNETVECIGQRYIYCVEDQFLGN